MNLNDLRARCGALETEARNLLTQADTNGRDLTADEARRFDELTGNITNLRGRIDREVEQREIDADVETSMRSLGINPSGAPGGDADNYADQLRNLALKRTGEPVLVRGVQNLSGSQPGLQLRALAKGTPAAGGYTVPTTLYDKIVTSMVETSAVLSAGATVINTNSGEDLVIPREATTFTAGITTEGSAISQADPTFNTVTLRSYKYGVLVKCNRELIEDTATDFLGYLARQTGQALGMAFGTHLVNGTGTNQPAGVLAGATLGTTGPTGATGGFGNQATAGQGTDLLNSLQASVLEPYAQSPAAAFISRNATRNAVRNLKTSAGDLVGGQWLATAPAPWYVDPFVPAVALSAKSVIFGDFSKYWVRIVNGIRFERSDEFAFDTDQVTFRAIIRADGAVIDPSAFKYFAGGAS